MSLSGRRNSREGKGAPAPAFPFPSVVLSTDSSLVQPSPFLRGGGGGVEPVQDPWWMLDAVDSTEPCVSYVFPLD